MRIRNHEEDVLCRQIYEEAKARAWPGLGQKVSDICRTINIPNVDHEFVLKSKIKEAVFNHHYKEMKEQIDQMKKLEQIKMDNFTEVQNYFLENP